MTDETKDDVVAEETVAEASDSTEATAKEEEVSPETSEEKETPSEEKTEEKVEEKVEEKKEEASAPETTEEAEDDFEVPSEYVELIEKVEKMTVLELHGLVKVLEKKFGVSAAAVAVAGGAEAGAAVEEKSDFIIHMTAIGDSKIAVIKALKAILGLGLKEAKELAESAPVDLKSGVKTEEAEEIKKALVEAGATVELK